MKKLCTSAQNLLRNRRHLDLYKGIQSCAGDLGVARLRCGLEILEQILSKWELTLLLKKQGNLVFPLKPIRK